jgi:hypothetical protein
MADPTYQPKVYRKQGGDELVVASGGQIKIETGGALVPNSGTQAAAIANAPAGGTGAAAGAYDTAANRDLLIGAVNSMLAALRGAGIIAP